jgi:hypothetical protein
MFLAIPFHVQALAVDAVQPMDDILASVVKQQQIPFVEPVLIRQCAERDKIPSFSQKRSHAVSRDADPHGTFHPDAAAGIGKQVVVGESGTHGLGIVWKSLSYMEIRIFCLGRGGVV